MRKYNRRSRRRITNSHRINYEGSTVLIVKIPMKPYIDIAEKVKAEQMAISENGLKM